MNINWEFWKREEKTPRQIEYQKEQDRISEIMSNKDVTTFGDWFEKIETYKELDEYWNSYACNSMSYQAVDNTIIYLKYLTEYVPFENITIRPSADSGNIRKMPENGKSGVIIYIQTEKRRMEIEFDKDEIFIWGYSHRWDNKKGEFSKEEYNWPWSDDDSHVTDTSEMERYIKWVDTSFLGYYRENQLKKLLKSI